MLQDFRRLSPWLKNTSEKYNPGNTCFLAPLSKYTDPDGLIKSCFFRPAEMYFKNVSRLLILLSALFYLISCTPQSCQEETEVLTGTSFYRSGTGRSEAPDSVTLYGAGKEGLYIYKKASGKQVIFIPLDASSGECSFVIGINGIYDTLEFTYSTYPHLLSKGCGYTFFHDILECNFSVNIIDTVIIRNKRVTNRNEENIRIFY